MKLFLAGILTVLSMVAGVAPQAEASRILYVAPQRIMIEPGQNTTTMTVMNQSDKKRGYDISLINSVMQEDGSTKRVDTFPYAAKRMIRYVPRSIELEPEERQTVRLMVRRPRDLEDGDYHTHIRFRERPLENPDPEKGEELSFQVSAQYGVAVPVIVRHGDIQSAIRIDSVDKEASSKDELVINFSRKGNAEAGAYMRVYRKMENGLVEISHPLWARAYRELDTVTRSVSLKDGEVLEGDLVLRLYKDPYDKEAVVDEYEVSF